MSREIFNAVKLNKKKTLSFEFNYNDEVIELKISIKRVGIDIAFDIWGSSSDEDIDMNIFISTKLFNKKNYNLLNAEIREFLRHEMEHIGQYHEVHGKEDIYGYPAATTEIDYFTVPYEIDAFLHGLNYKRKFLKTNIIDEITHLLRHHYYISDLGTFLTIQNAWIARLNIILPHTLNND
jgi:Fe-S cluster biosynthesis and repair protein YggX